MAVLPNIHIPAVIQDNGDGDYLTRDYQARCDGDPSPFDLQRRFDILLLVGPRILLRTRAYFVPECYRCDGMAGYEGGDVIVVIPLLIGRESGSVLVKIEGMHADGGACSALNLGEPLVGH